MTAKDIEKACEQQLKYDYIISNVYFFPNESDVLLIRKSGMITSCEIKISRSDFKVDFKKPWHQNLLNRDKENITNYFYYICTENLIRLDECPKYAGLYYVCKNGRIKTIKTAPKLHSYKHPYKEPLFNKLYWAYRESKTLKSDEGYKELRKEIRVLETAVKRLEEEKRLLNRSYREIISEKRQLEKELKLVI